VALAVLWVPLVTSTGRRWRVHYGTVNSQAFGCNKTIDMDVLKAEMERKRKEREAAAVSLGDGAGTAKKKWMKRGDVEKLRVAQYHEAEAREAEERKARQHVPCLRYREAPDANSLAIGEVVEAESKAACSAMADDDVTALQPAEVMSLLRKLGQPIKLFSEDNEARLERYRAVRAAAPTVNQEHLELKQGQSWGQNEMQMFDSEGRAIQEGVQEDNDGDEGDQNDEDGADDPLNMLSATSEQIVHRQFKSLIKLWENKINERSEAQIRSMEGKKETAAYLQSRRHMKPFFKQLKSRTMPLDLVQTMVEITEHMQKRDYVKAHDAYISCAIGNAPWPMGISGTGVHERQGRQHIRENKVAHVMNDETQRKYLQSVKRLLTFAQKALPPSGPSMMVS